MEVHVLWVDFLGVKLGVLEVGFGLPGHDYDRIDRQSSDQFSSFKVHVPGLGHPVTHPVTPGHVLSGKNLSLPVHPAFHPGTPTNTPSKATPGVPLDIP